MNHILTHVRSALPDDAAQASLAGRVWRPDQAGPSVIMVRDGAVQDISALYPTMRDLCEVSAPAAALRTAIGEPIGTLADLLANTPPDTRNSTRPWLLTPIDLQAIKAAGVTFAISMLERVIEERARGDMNAAGAIRDEITRLVGDDLGNLKPGSPELAHLKEVLIQQGAWSQYPGSGHRLRCRNLHQVSADGRRRHRHGCRHPPGLLLEQPRA